MKKQLKSLIKRAFVSKTNKKQHKDVSFTKKPQTKITIENRLRNATYDKPANIPMLIIQTYNPPPSALIKNREQIKVRKGNAVNGLFLNDDNYWLFVKTSDDSEGFIPKHYCNLFQLDVKDINKTVNHTYMSIKEDDANVVPSNMSFDMMQQNSTNLSLFSVSRCYIDDTKINDNKKKRQKVMVNSGKMTLTMIEEHLRIDEATETNASHDYENAPLNILNKPIVQAPSYIPKYKPTLNKSITMKRTSKTKIISTKRLKSTRRLAATPLHNQINTNKRKISYATSTESSDSLASLYTSDSSSSSTSTSSIDNHTKTNDYDLLTQFVSTTSNQANVLKVIKDYHADFNDDISVKKGELVYFVANSYSTMNNEWVFVKRLNDHGVVQHGFIPRSTVKCV